MSEVTNEILLERLNTFIETSQRERAEDKALVEKERRDDREQNSIEHTRIESEAREAKEQGKKTNGTVAKVSGNQKFMWGGIAVLTTIVVPLIFMFLAQYLASKK